MRRAFFIIVATAFGPAHAQEHDHEHHHDHAAMSVGAVEAATLTITINPEARVSVMRTGELPAAVECGKALEVPVAIANQGMVTAPLEASLVGSVPEGVVLEFSAEPLKGTAEERRALRLTLTKAPLVDVTVAFRAKNDIPDLGGRDRVHLLVRCR